MAKNGLSRELASLQQQLEEEKKNLRQIRERKSKYVLEIDVPLQLEKEEKEKQERIAKLEADISTLNEGSSSPPLTPSSSLKWLIIFGGILVALVFIGLWAASKLTPPPSSPDTKLSIDSLKTGAEVDVQETITGTYAGFPVGWRIYGVTRERTSDNAPYHLYAPQDLPAGKGAFSIDGYFGDRTKGPGVPYEFFVVAVPANSPAEDQLKQRKAGSTDPLPEQGVVRSQPITVTRVGPTDYWYADYWPDTELESGKVKYTENITMPFLFLRWGEGSPSEQIPNDGWGAQFVRRVSFPRGGVYRFYVEHDDAARVRVDNQPLITAWEHGDDVRESAVVTLTPGYHELAVDFADFGQDANIGFWYEEASVSHDKPDVTDSYWLIAYYTNPEFKNDPVEYEIYSMPNLEKQWGDTGGTLVGNGAVVQTLSDYFSTRSEREVAFNAGLYQFEISGDTGVALKIDNQIIYENDSAWKECLPCNVVVDLTEGKHRVQVDQWDNVLNARIKLTWNLAKLTWRTFSNPYDTRAMAVEDKYVWTGGAGGLVRWDKQTLEPKVFHPEDGLPDNLVNALLIDRKENLWIGSGEGYSQGGSGLAWFDGNNWQTFTTANGLCDNAIFGLYQDADGSLWISTGYGLNNYNLDSNRWRCYTPRDGLGSYYPLAVLRDQKGQLWVSVGDDNQKMSVLKTDGTWKTYDKSTIPASAWGITPAAEDNQGNLWLGGWGGLVRFDGQQWKVYTDSTELPSNDIYAIVKDQAGNMWFGTGNGLVRYDGTNWKTFTTSDGLASNLVTGLAVDKDGILWTGHAYDGGISRYEGKSWIAVPQHEAIVPNRITDLFRVQDGKLWIATGWPPTHGDADGVRTLDKDLHWERFTPDDCLKNKYVDVVFQDEAGNMWFGYGTANGGVTRYNGETCETFDSASGPAGTQVVDILQDCDGGLWFATLDGGVSYYSNGEWYTFDIHNAHLPSNQINALFKDQACHIWLGTDAGVVERPDRDHWNVFTTDNGLASNQITGIAQTTDGDLWFGSSGQGVSRFQANDQTWQIYHTGDGLLSDKVYTLHASPNGWLWVGTPDGVSIYTGERWLNYTPQDGLASRHVRSIWEDVDGTVWLGTSGGLSRLQFQEASK